MQEEVEKRITNTNNIPLYMNKKDIAKYVGVSVTTIDRLIASDILKENIHYKKLYKQELYFVDAVARELKPRGYDAYFNTRQKESHIS